jgi:uncharacterized alpha-E superfamily protein
MLSRVADNLYWMSRYLERGEHTARLLDVNLSQMLDETPDALGRRWERLLAGLQTSPPSDRPADAEGVTRLLAVDPRHPASIVSCMVAARENARNVREQISSEMWEQINTLFLLVRRTSADDAWRAEPHAFFKEVKEGSHLFQGITDATMSHGEGWQFIQAGRFIERAGATAALLDVHFRTLEPGRPRESDELDYLDWVGLLKSCTAFEAYCKVYTADVQPDRTAEFLLLNDEFPRSVRFAADTVQTALQAIARATGARTATRAERLAGRLRAALDYTQVDEIMAGNMHAYLDGIQRQCAQIHVAIHQIYIAYPIDAALVS